MLLFLMPGELSDAVASTRLRRSVSVMIFTCFPHEELSTIHGVSVSHDANQQRAFPQCTFISAELSTDLHDQCLVQFFREPLQIVLIRQYHEVVTAVK